MAPDAVTSALSALRARNGLPEPAWSFIEPHRTSAGAWRVKFSYEAGEPLSMNVAQALAMAADLRSLGEIELAEELASATASARRYGGM